MSANRRRKGLRTGIGVGKRRDALAIGFLMFMGVALLVVGYLWVEAQNDRRALGVYTNGGLPPS